MEFLHNRKCLKKKFRTITHIPGDFIECARFEKNSAFKIKHAEIKFIPKKFRRLAIHKKKRVLSD